MSVVRTIICGSPQAQGKCHSVAGCLADALRLRFPGDELRFLCVAQASVAPCRGCNVCASVGRCVQRDDMDEVLAALSESSCLFVVSPVYFAGPPAQLKALFDRLQPLYFQGVLGHSADAQGRAECGVVSRDGAGGVGSTGGACGNADSSVGGNPDITDGMPMVSTVRKSATSGISIDGGEGVGVEAGFSPKASALCCEGAPCGAKKPAYLMAVGAGSDPHGWAPLETICRSSLAVAGWKLQESLPLIGMETSKACSCAESWLDELGKGECL